MASSIGYLCKLLVNNFEVNNQHQGITPRAAAIFRLDRIHEAQAPLQAYGQTIENHTKTTQKHAKTHNIKLSHIKIMAQSYYIIQNNTQI